MTWVIFLPFLAALAAPLLFRVLGRFTGLALALLPAGLTLYLATRLPWNGAELLTATPWATGLGVDFATRLDGLSASFALLISGIGVLILIYSAGYFGSDRRQGRFYAFLLSFMGAMLGIVLADDLITLYVFWELTSLFSFLLIGFDHKKPEARSAALKSLLVTTGGGLAMLAGFVLLIIAATQAGKPLAEAARISALAGLELRGSPFYAPALILIVIGAFTKSAQFPFHFWLPAAMTAPTPVSAYLHSATMVKAGVFLLARLSPALGGTGLWLWLVTPVGAITMLVGAAMAAGQHDVKRILAYATVSVLGILTMLLGLGTEEAIKAAVVYVFAHALYKVSLFLVAGTLDRQTGTRDVTQLGGLFRVMPAIAMAALLAALSQAGAPPLFGFLGKELLLKVKLDLEWVGRVLIVLATLANIFLVAMARVIAIWPFYRAPRPTPRQPHHPPLAMSLTALVPAILSLLVGLVPNIFDQTLGLMASAIAGQPVAIKLELWHGLNPAALISMAITAATLTVGFLLFLRLHTWLKHTVAAAHHLERRGPAAAYDFLYEGLERFAKGLTAIVHSGYLRRYVLVILLVLIVAVGYPALRAFPADCGVLQMSLRWPEAGLALLALAGALLAVAFRSPLASVVALGVTGMAIALLSATFSAPDLAITLVGVEILSVVLFVLLLRHLPREATRRSPRIRLRDATVAIVAGGTMALLVLAAAQVPDDLSIAQFFAKAAYSAGHGRNIVNVILVDFRALDTLGEITVIGAAAMGVLAILRLARRTQARERQ